MRVSECTVRKIVPFTINVQSPEEREKINQLGQNIAEKENLHYEGYIAYTGHPYSMNEAKVVLYFD